MEITNRIPCHDIRKGVVELSHNVVNGGWGTVQLMRREMNLLCYIGDRNDKMCFRVIPAPAPEPPFTPIKTLESPHRVCPVQLMLTIF